MEGNQGFEFMGGALVPLGTGANPGKELAAASTVAQAPPTHPNLGDMDPGLVDHAINGVEQRALAPMARVAAAQTPPLKPRTLVQQARERVKEINVELRRVKALEKERDELQRLIKAAKGKRAPVRLIKPEPQSGAGE